MLFLSSSALCEYGTVDRENLDQSLSYFARLLIGSFSNPTSNIAPITKDGLSSPLRECQRLQGKITGEALGGTQLVNFDI